MTIRPRRAWRRWRSAQLLLLAVYLAAAACADHVVDPAPGADHAPLVPSGPARAFVSPVSDEVLSAPALRVPGSNAVQLGATPWTELPADVGDAEWVELRTTGEITRTINWAAGEGQNSWFCFGSNAYPFAGAGSSGGDGIVGGHLRVAATLSGSKPAEGEYGAVMLAEGGQVYRLSRAWPGARLYARRTGLGGVCNGIPWYHFEGEHRVEVRKVVPVQVKPDKESFQAGEVLTWTTKLYPGLTRLTWIFQRTDGALEYPGCGAESCDYAPRGPGRMLVSARWEGADPVVDVHGYSPPVTDKPPTIVLACTGDLGPNRVTRGQSLTCVASKDPADAPGELAISGWSFAKRPRQDGVVTSAEWAGIMVEPGSVVVQGMIGGHVAQPATAAISVVDRNWTDVLQQPLIAHDECPVRTDECLQSPPAQFQDLGKTRLPKFTFTPDFRYISEGPNTGWWYFAGQTGPIELPRPITLLHPDVFDPASEFYKRRSCSPARVQEWIVGHERTHWEIGQAELRQSPINPWLEQRRIFDPSGSPDRWYNRTLGTVRERAAALMDPDHKLASKYPPTPCNLRLGTNTPVSP